MDQDIHNINPIERIVRLAFSITLVLIPFNVDTPLGGFVLLPLLAIYLGLTGSLGWDPLLAGMSRIARRARSARDATGHHHPAARRGHGLAGHA
jgi:hypothetical protein